MPFLLLPLFTRYFSVEDFGRIGVASAAVSILAIIIGFNPALFIIAHYHKFKQRVLASYIYQILLFSLASYFIITIFLMLLTPSFLLKEYEIGYLGLLILISLALGRAVINIGLTILQMEKNALYYFYYSLLSSALMLIFVFVFVIAAKAGWKGIFTSELIAVVIAGFFLFLRLKRTDYIQKGFSREKLKKVFSFSLPLVPHVLALWVMNSIDRFFLAEMVGMEAVGLYSVAYTVGLGISLLHESFQRAWQPYFFEYLSRDDPALKLKIVRYTWLYYIGSVLLFFIYVGTISFVMPYLVGNDFLPSVQFIPMIVLGCTFLGTYRVVSGYLYHTGNTKVLALVSVLAAILNAVLNYILIMRNGAIGAAQATAITFLFSFVVVKILAMRYYEMPWFIFHLQTKEQQ